MKKTWRRFGPIIAASLITSAAAALFLVMYPYRHADTADIGTLRDMQQEIENRCAGPAQEKFSLCSYPEFDFGDRISIGAEGADVKKPLLNLYFATYKEKYFLGVHYHLSILLSPHVDMAELRFKAKGLAAYSAITGIDVCLKEGQLLNRSVCATVPVNLKDEWTGYSVPLIDFDGDDFTWIIQDILFSISPEGAAGNARISISDVTIVDSIFGKVIYELL